mmetsp:Transcript_22953/g.53580  ORF Transcript_22953/g.53580 Transcript_22953/m.53580 type:complete len:343 (+) Transcript_22953:1217-2245(+)
MEGGHNLFNWLPTHFHDLSANGLDCVGVEPLQLVDPLDNDLLSTLVSQLQQVDAVTDIMLALHPGWKFRHGEGLHVRPDKAAQADARGIVTWNGGRENEAALGLKNGVRDPLHHVDKGRDRLYWALVRVKARHFQNVRGDVLVLGLDTQLLERGRDNILVQRHVLECERVNSRPHGVDWHRCQAQTKRELFHVKDGQVRAKWDCFVGTSGLGLEKLQQNRVPFGIQVALHPITNQVANRRSRVSMHVAPPDDRDIGVERTDQRNEPERLWVINPNNINRIKNPFRSHSHEVGDAVDLQDFCFALANRAVFWVLNALVNMHGHIVEHGCSINDDPVRLYPQIS